MSDRIGDLAAQDSYDPFAAEQFVNPAVQSTMGALLAPRVRDENSSIAYRTASPLVNISEQDIADATDKAMAFSGGGLGIKAYHGSPHDFSAFDMSKIGTGEGAQAYGHGLYFAEHEPIAKGYRDRLAGPPEPSKFQYDGQDVWGNVDRLPPDIRRGVMELHGRLSLYKDPTALLDRTRAGLENTIKNYETGAIPMDPYHYGDAQAALKTLNDPAFAVTPPKASPGHMYEVNINADPAHFLDWDKPLKDQPHLAAKLPDSLKQEISTLGQQSKEGWGDLGVGSTADDYATGQKLVQHLANTGRTTDALREAGIPGIKYLDQGSRNLAMLKAEPHEFLDGSQGWKVNGPKGDQVFDTLNEANDFIKAQGAGGSSNYVVFNDKLIDILRKYGIAGLPAGAAGMGALAQQDNYQP